MMTRSRRVCFCDVERFIGGGYQIADGPKTDMPARSVGDGLRRDQPVIARGTSI